VNLYGDLSHIKLAGDHPVQRTVQQANSEALAHLRLCLWAPVQGLRLGPFSRSWTSESKSFQLNS
jgi:hypothetical protein